MQKLPYFLRNPFLAAFARSHKRLLTLVNHYMGQLEAGKSNAELIPLLDQIQSAYQEYTGMYDALISTMGLRKGETLRLADTFKELKKKLRHWKLLIVLEYDEKTPEYISIFPGGISAFREGTIDEQIRQVNALAGRLASYPNLSTIHGEVVAYAATLSQVRDTQQKQSGSADDTSEELNAKRTGLCNILYAHLGWFIWKNPANPELIEKFFPYHLMRTHKKDENGNETGDEDGETLAIPPASVKASGITFTDDTPFSFYNSGHVALGIYTATDTNATVPAGVHILQPDEELEITATGLGNAGNTLLLVNNPDANTAGELEINIME